MNKVDCKIKNALLFWRMNLRDTSLLIKSWKRNFLLIGKVWAFILIGYNPIWGNKENDYYLNLLWSFKSVEILSWKNYYRPVRSELLSPSAIKIIIVLTQLLLFGYVMIISFCWDFILLKKEEFEEIRQNSINRAWTPKIR